MGTVLIVVGARILVFWATVLLMTEIQAFRGGDLVALVVRSGMLFFSLGDLPDPGIESVFPSVAGGFFTPTRPGNLDEKT